MAKKLLSKLASIKNWAWGHKKISIFIIVVLLGGFLFWRNSSGKKLYAKETTIEKGSIQEVLILSGEVDATEHAKLRFPASGKLTGLRVKEGQEVNKGQVLGSIDSTILAANLVIARSNYRATQAEVEKIHDDVKGHDKDETLTQKLTRTDAEVANDNAFDAVRVAQKNLNDATLYSPFKGIVTTVTYPYTGINVSLTETAFEIVNPSTIYFKVAADQTEVNKVRIGQKVNITLDANADKNIEGSVINIALTPTEGEVGSVYKVTVAIPSGLEGVLIGMTGDAKFVLSEKDDVLIVPSEYINRSPEGTYVKTDLGRSKVFVETGIEGEDTIEVKGSIESGQKIYD